MRLIAALLWGVLLATFVSGAEAATEKRVALVLGNSSYQKVKALPNPSRDAQAVAALLRASGFDRVEVRENLTGADMRRAIRDFSDHTRDADVAVVYYAGHGMEVDGTNFLLPIDVTLERDIDVEDEAVSLDRVLKILEPARRLRLVILDACRDNPFTRSMRRTTQSRSIGRGLARIEPTTTDTLVAFAAKAGSTADDGTGLHSPFTTALLKNLAIPGLDLRIAFGRVRDDVLATTNHRQEPFVYGSLGGSTVSLMPALKPVEPTPAPVASAPAPVKPVVAVPAVPVDREAIARRDYEFAVQVSTMEAWDAFLGVHKTGFYADLARAQRSKLEAQMAAKAQTPAQTPAPAPSLAPTPVPTAAPTIVQAPPAAAPQQPSNGIRVSALPQQPEQPISRIVSDPIATARVIHSELKRLGCYNGQTDHGWNEESKAAVEVFNRHAGTNLDSRSVKLETVDVLRAKRSRVCPLICAHGFRVKGDACVKIVCRRGYVVGDRGECERPARTNTAVRPPVRHEPAAPRVRNTESDTRRVVCGDNGCLPIRPGCRGEVRPSGHGEVAVVWCR